MILDYKVTEKERSRLEWHSRVLQSDYANHINTPAKSAFRELVEGLQGLDIGEFNTKIHEGVIGIRDTYPEEFTESPEGFGWYNKKMLVGLYIRGFISLEGITEENVEEVTNYRSKEYKEKQQEARKKRKEAKEERERAEERYRIERQHRAEEAEAAREDVKVGMIFRIKADIDKAYKEVARKKLRTKGERDSVLGRERVWKEMVKVVKVKGGWKVVEVFEEGGRRW